MQVWLDLVEQGKATHEAVEDSLNQTLHQEVTKSGIKLDPNYQVNLPDLHILNDQFRNFPRIEMN